MGTNTVDSFRATLETDSANMDRANFFRYDLAKRVNSFLFDHTNDNAVDSTGYAQRLNGSTNEKLGLAKSFAVMPGDVIKAEVYAKYADPNSGNWEAALTQLMGYITSPGTAPAGTIVDGSGYSSSSTTPLGITPICHRGDTDNGVPKAYLNYIFINKNFDVASVRPLYVRISSAAREDGSDVQHEKLSLEDAITEEGYVYVYLSNDGETTKEVYFDDFKITHVKSPIIQSQDYYPFGLTFNSYQREDGLNNPFQYNGKEVQDEGGLGWVDYGARMYMPEIGRWNSLDPKAEPRYNWTPYRYGYDNPVRFFDPDGMTEEERQKAVEWARQYIADHQELAYNRDGVNDCSGYINLVLTAVGFPNLKTGDEKFRGENNGVSQLARHMRQVGLTEARVGDVLMMCSFRNPSKGADGEFDHTGMVTQVYQDEQGNVTGYRIANFQGAGLREFDYMFTDGDPKKPKANTWVSLRGAYQWDTVDGKGEKSKGSSAGRGRQKLTLEVMSDPVLYRDWLKSQLEVAASKDEYHTRDTGTSGGSRR